MIQTLTPNCWCCNCCVSNFNIEYCSVVAFADVSTVVIQALTSNFVGAVVDVAAVIIQTLASNHLVTLVGVAFVVLQRL